MLVYSVIVVSALLVSSDAAKTPSYVQRCKKGDDACALKSAQAALPHIEFGDRKYKIPSLNPLVVPKVEVEQANLKIRMDDMKFYFLDNLKFTHVTFNFTNNTFGYGFNTPHVDIVSDYDFSGKILIVPFTGKGICNVTIDNFTLVAQYNFSHETRKDGKEYIKFLDGRYIYNSVSKVGYDFTNLFNGDKVLAETTLRYMNENWKDVYDELNSVFLEALSLQEKFILNNVAGEIPNDELWLE